MVMKLWQLGSFLGYLAIVAWIGYALYHIGKIKKNGLMPDIDDMPYEPPGYYDPKDDDPYP